MNNKYVTETCHIATKSVGNYRQKGELSNEG